MKTKLTAVLSGADRIEVYSTAIELNEKAPPLEKKPLAVVEGASAGREFLGVWTIAGHSSDWECMCDGDLYLDFYHGSKKLQRLRYFHCIAFRVEDGALSGTAWIKKEDREKLLRWLKQHGAESLRLRVEEEPTRRQRQRAGIDRESHAPAPLNISRFSEGLTPRSPARVSPLTIAGRK